MKQRNPGIKTKQNIWISQPEKKRLNVEELYQKHPGNLRQYDKTNAQNNRNRGKKETKIK